MSVAIESHWEATDRDRLVAAATRRCSELPPIHLQLGPARLRPHGVAIASQPTEALLYLRHALQDADAETRGSARVPDWRAPLHPHITLAYANTQSDAASLRDDLAAVETETTVALTVETVSLLRLHRTERLYHWDRLATVTLATPGKPPPG